jgi:uncharacterized protein YoxC
MTALLIVLTIAEIVAVLAVLVIYLVAIARSLRRTATTLGKVAFGVRAIETQCETIGAAVPPLNARLHGVSTALADLAALASTKAPSG